MAEKEREKCIGCGAESSEFPVVGIAIVDGVKAAHPICVPCWTTPTRRQPGTPPMHFFPAKQKESALKAAGSSTVIVSTSA